MITIEIDKKHFSFDSSIPAAATAFSGDVIRFCCTDCYDGQIVDDGMDYSLIDGERSNPVTGPLYLEGAQPGDLLRIEVLKIQVADYGVMCVRSGHGVYNMEGCHVRRFSVGDGYIYFDRGLKIPVRPMIGIIGCCPEGDPVSTHTPGNHGGNLDIRELGEGSVLFLPVQVPGAMVSAGDLHAVQGDGETAICAMETSGEVQLRIDVIPGGAGLLPTPFLETDKAYYTIASDASLDQCSVKAAEKMQQMLIKYGGLTDAQAAMFLSLTGNLRISQVVNPEKGCMMELSKADMNFLLPGEK